MKLDRSKFVALLLAGALMTALAGCSQPAEAPAESPAETPVESPAVTETAAPDGEAPASLFVDLKTVDMDGNEVDSSVFEGNTLTVVNVWNLGCTPCIEELPTLDQLNQDYADQGVEVMGLYYSGKAELTDMAREEIRDLLTKKEVTYRHLEPNQAIMDSVEMQALFAFPTTYFVDANGELLGAVVGAKDYEEWSGIIEAVLELVEEDA